MPRLSVELSSETAKAILGLARDVAPKEFSSFIAGRLEKGVLRLDGLLYQPYTASEDSAWVHVDLPLTSGAKATVHSHPSGHSHDLESHREQAQRGPPGPRVPASQKAC